MTTVQLIALTVGASGLIPPLAARIRVPPAIALLVAGVALALIPGVPELQLDPFVVIFLLLPPIVYAATLRSSLRRLAHIVRWAVAPGVLLILVPMVAAAVIAHAVIDDLAWSSAFVIGGVTTATGAEALIAADADLRLPRRLLTRMKAETTLLPLVLLPLILIAIDAGVTDEFALGSASADYLYDIVGGLTIGIVVGFVGLWARRSTPEGPPQIAVSFAIPFLAGLAGHAATASVIAAIIAAGFVIEAFYSGRVVGRPYSAGTQEIGRAFWLQTTLILAGSLSFIVGLSIPTAVEDVDVATAPMIAYVAAALALVTALRFAIGYATAGCGRDAARVPRAKGGLVLAWGGTRTPLAFVIALLVPPVVASGAPFPDRDLILVFTAALVLSSVLIQGGTLGLLLRALGLSGDDGLRREEQAARRVLAQVGDRRDAAFEAERAALVRLYDADEIGEETMLRLRQEIDLAASALPRTERAVGCY